MNFVNLPDPSAAGERTSSTLLEGVKANDEGAWRRLVERYGGLVLHWCRRAGLQEEDRADVFQEVFRAVARHVSSFERRETPAGFRAWLRSITRSKVADFFRRPERAVAAAGGSSIRQWFEELPADESASSMGSDEAEEESVLASAALQRVRAEFEERTWQAFWRTAVDGQATDVVAAELGLSSGAIYVAKSRILKRLREELRDL